MSQNLLEQVIRKRIERAGPISFENFMDLSLYHPEFGYYAAEKIMLGPNGDYYTSPHLHPIFGWLLANQLDEIKRMMGDPEDFTVLEVGAGRGLLAEGILTFVRRNLKWKGNWKYLILEKHPRTVEDQRKQLAAHTERVAWKSSCEEIDPFCGCIISNELLDAFPVHLVVMNDRFKEIYVSICDEGFNEIYGDLSNPNLTNYINRYQIPAISGYRTEINLRIWEYLKSLDAILSEGFIISIDYGYSSRDYYAPERSKGTLLCYRKHMVNEKPYANVGKQDITAHVNFTALRDWGNNLGMRTVGYCPQGIFLASLGIDKIVAKELEADRTFQTELLKIKGLLFGMGDTHKVFIHYKGKKEMPLLRGFEIRNKVHTL